MRKRINKTNKKGDVPVMVLVIGVVVICILTIFSFISFNKAKNKNSFESGIQLFEQVYSDLEMFYFYKGVIGQDESDEKIKDLKLIGEKVLIEKSGGGVEVSYEVQLTD